MIPYEIFHQGYEGPFGSKQGYDRQEAPAQDNVRLRDVRSPRRFPAHCFQAPENIRRCRYIRIKKMGSG